MPEEDDAVRIGTAERERAQAQLGTHFSAGRLDVGEFEERSGLVAAARTRGELAPVFADLPADPAVPAAAPAPAVRPTPTAPAPRDEGALSGWRGAAVASVGLLSVVAFFVLMGVGVSQAWLVFFAVPVVGALARGSRGQG